MLVGYFVSETHVCMNPYLIPKITKLTIVKKSNNIDDI